MSQCPKKSWFHKEKFIFRVYAITIFEKKQTLELQKINFPLQWRPILFFWIWIQYLLPSLLLDLSLLLSLCFNQKEQDFLSFLGQMILENLNDADQKKRFMSSQFLSLWFLLHCALDTTFSHNFAEIIF